MEPALASIDALSKGSVSSRSGWPFHLVRIMLGLLLLTAAVLKYQDYSVDGVGRFAFLSSARLYVAVLLAEAGLGIWLLIGRAARVLWLVALLFFFGLAVVSLYLVFVGLPSCGCFGKWTVSPWCSFSLDLLADAALVLCRGQVYSKEGVSLTGFFRQLLPVAAGTAVILAIIFGVLTGIYGSPTAALTSLRGESVTVDPPVSDLGTGLSGETRVLTIHLTNHTAHPIRIPGGSSDCSCIATEGLPFLLEAGETRSMNIRAKRIGRVGSIARLFFLYADDAIQPVIVARLNGRTVEQP